MTNRDESYFLGQGVSFPLRISPQGNLEISGLARNIRESILLILMTDLGERVFRPDFGCRLSELVFAPIDNETLMLMQIWVQEALEQWEPRIIVDSVLAVPTPESGRVDITINYRHRDTYEPQFFVYPFYTRSSNLQ
jgi:phage baseplate assembly protein W